MSICVLSSGWVCGFAPSSQSRSDGDLPGWGSRAASTGGMIRRMSRWPQLQRRPLLLAGAASTGVIGGHPLHAPRLLPGVHESAQVRAAALAPRYTVMTVLGAALLALVAEWLLRRRRPWLAVVVLVAGQTGLLALPETLAESAGRSGGEGGDAGEVAKLPGAGRLPGGLAPRARRGAPLNH